MNKKDTKKKNNLLDDIFYLDNRTVKYEELEITEEIKLGYGVTVGKKRKSNDKHTTVKAQFETRIIIMDVTRLAFACIHIVTNICCSKGYHKGYTQLSY